MNMNRAYSCLEEKRETFELKFLSEGTEVLGITPLSYLLHVKMVQ